MLETDSGGTSKDEFIDNIAKGILDKVPPEYDINKVKKSFGISVSPTGIVLFQELERFNKLINMMKRTLTQLRKVRALSLIFQLTITTNKQRVPSIRVFHMSGYSWRNRNGCNA